MSRIKTTFAALAANKKKALITFITAGDPSPALTVPLLHALVAGGADILELGVPFSDPMAEGPTIQRAAQRSLAAKTRMSDVLGLVARFRATDNDTPIVLMGYFNPIYVHGVPAFVVEAKEAGVDGLIVVDLPPEEDDELCLPALEAGLNFIRLATPTTDDKRLPKVLQNTSGFVYYVSITGITGEGMFAPVIKGEGRQDPVVAIKGPGPLPEARHIDGAEMSRPGLDSDWISIETWVSEVMTVGPDVILVCHSENCDFHIVLDNPLLPKSVPWDLAESRVRARGVVATTFNRGRQMTARFLRVGSISDITPLNPRKTTTTEPKLCNPEELMQATGPGPGDLVRVRGVATLALPGRGIFLQVDGGGLWVQTAQPIAATPGTIIEVIGWPRAGELKPFIRAHRASVLGITTPPVATALKASDALKAVHEAEWVSVDAELLDSFHGSDGTTLELRDSDVIFRGLIPDAPNKLMPRLQKGSRIRISGIARVTSIGSIILRVEDKLQILARSPADVELLSPPPLWTARNVSILAALIIAGLLGVFGLTRARRREAQGYGFSYDMLGEAATTATDAARYLASYEQAIHAIGEAVKPLHARALSRGAFYAAAA